MDKIKYLIVVFLCLILSGCEKEFNCCPYNYWTTYNNPSVSISEECECCYDITGRIMECPQ